MERRGGGQEGSSIRTLVHLVLLLYCAGQSGPPRPQDASDTNVSMSARALTTARIYWLGQLYFTRPDPASASSFDSLYEKYIQTVLAVQDRREFDLATIEFVSRLHNGHTFFWDSWLDNSNQQLAFYVAPLGGYWVVQTSSMPDLKPGDIVVSIDNKSAEAFFQQQQRYISASSTAAQRHNLFLLPYLFPAQFTVTLDGNRKVTIDRDKWKAPEQKTDGRWLTPGVTAYIRVPAFNQPRFEQGALDFIKQFRDAKTLIIDVRNNSGGVTPPRLIEMLMDRPYHEWKESTAAEWR